MQLQLPKPMQQCGEQKSSHQGQSQGGLCLGQWLVCPLIKAAKALRRRTLVSNMFKYVKEIHSIDHGYTLRFDRSDDLEDLNELVGKIANYIIFESRNAPQLTFEVVEEPGAKRFWLQVRSLEGNVSDMGSAYMSFYPSRFHLV